jgi:hypothetical protein
LVKPIVAMVLEVAEAVAVTDVGTDGALAGGGTGTLGTGVGTGVGTGDGGTVTVPPPGKNGACGTGIGTGLGETIALGEGEGDGNCDGLGDSCAAGGGLGKLGDGLDSGGREGTKPALVLSTVTFESGNTGENVSVVLIGFCSKNTVSAAAIVALPRAIAEFSYRKATKPLTNTREFSSTLFFGNNIGVFVTFETMH